MIDQLEKEIHEGMLDLYQHQSMSRERESLVYFYFAGIHNENITLQELLEEKQTRIDKAIEYIETCNPNVDLNSMFLNENYISNYGAKELLNILRGEDKE